VSPVPPPQAPRPMHPHAATLLAVFVIPQVRWGERGFEWEGGGNKGRC